MAKCTTKPVMFLYLVVVLSFLFIASIAESRSILQIGLIGKAAKAECETVYGVAKGDTCFAVAQMFNLTTQFFDTINPNINCTAIFVGQWLCVDGSAN